MVYFVGRDVAVWLGTEEQNNGLFYSGSASGPNWNLTDASSVTNYTRFALPTARGTEGSEAEDWGFDYITGVDLSIGAMDEDITYGYETFPETGYPTNNIWISTDVISVTLANNTAFDAAALN